MKTIITTITASMLALASIAGGPIENGPKGKEAKVDTKNSTVYWTGKKVTGEHTGTLMLKEGTVTFTDGVPTATTIVLDMKSIAVTDIEDPEYNGKLVGHLNSPDFFAVNEFATGSFVANKITPIKGAKDRDANYTLDGTLTLKGIAEKISFPAYIAMENGVVTANGALTFDRTKYDIKYGSGSFFDDLGDKVIYDDVELNFVLSAK